VRKPPDTSLVAPELRLGRALTSGSIEDQILEDEREGGEAMVEADVVPTRGAELVEAFGFVLGPTVKDDPIFREVVEAPEGWTRELGDNPHGYWTYLVDPDGARRVAMFYKAAFYDRRAHCQRA
jgi:hypothetical protein